MALCNMTEASAARKARLLAVLDGCRIREPFYHRHPEKMCKVKRVHRFGDYLVNTGLATGACVYSMCNKKTRYRSQSEAVDKLHAIKRYRPDTSLYVYYCDICRGWHLTHKPRNRGQEK